MKDNLKEDIEAAKTGKPAEAQYYLKKAINQNPNYVTAWLWLAYVVDDPRKQKDCMKRMINFLLNIFLLLNVLDNLIRKMIDPLTIGLPPVLVPAAMLHQQAEVVK
ncbi:MAG: hypothetical protein U9R53_12485 [Chloroflexota bacterium]|nr:hypothetical protein [Chloroflexota bacterium]